MNYPISIYIASNFSDKEVQAIVRFLKREMEVKNFCKQYNGPYDPPNEQESDYKRRQRLKCRIKYHIKKGSL